MHKKVIIIIAIIVGLLMVGGGIVGAILISQRPATPAASTESPVSDLDADPAKQEAQTTPDLSIDLGACTAVTHEVLNEALVPPLKDVRDAINRGFGHEANGDKSQSCVYPFSVENTLNNRFTLTVTEFKDATNKADAIKGLASYTELPDIGEKAGYSAATDTDLKQNSYMLLFVEDMKLYSLILLQPLDSDVFSKETAQAALVTIAHAIR